MSWLYVLQVETEGLVVQVALNGCEVFSDWEGASRIAQLKVNPYIIEGENRLDVALTPMTDDEGRALDVDRSLTVTLIRGVHGVDPGDAGRIARFTWDAAALPVEPGALTPVWTRQFTVRPEQAFGRWAWQDAPIVAPTAADAQELVALAGKIHAALSARDVAAVRDLTALRDREMARALDIPDDEMSADVDAYLRDWFESPGWAMDPFDPNALAASPSARGRLMRVTDAYGGAPLKGGNTERRFAFPFAATRVDGVWVVARP